MPLIFPMILSELALYPRVYTSSSILTVKLATGIPAYQLEPTKDLLKLNPQYANTGKNNYLIHNKP